MIDLVDCKQITSPSMNDIIHRIVRGDDNKLTYTISRY